MTPEIELKINGTAKTTRIFIDSEVEEFNGSIRIKSIGATTEDNVEFYAEIIPPICGLDYHNKVQNLYPEYQSEKTVQFLHSDDTIVMNGDSTCSISYPTSSYGISLKSPLETASNEFMELLLQFSSIELWFDTMSVDIEVLQTMLYYSSGHPRSMPPSLHKNRMFDIGTLIRLLGIDPLVSRKLLAYGTEVIQLEGNPKYGARALKEIYKKYSKTYEEGIRSQVGI